MKFRDISIRPRRARRTIALCVTTLAVTATVLAVGGGTASALSCSAGQSCDVLSLQLKQRLDSIANSNPGGKAAFLQATADNEAAAGNALGRWFHAVAAHDFSQVNGDANGDGQRDIDQANFHLSIYWSSADHSSSASLSWLGTAEGLITNLERLVWDGTVATNRGNEVTDTWRANLASPFGALESVKPIFNTNSGRYDKVAVSGWAIDPDSQNAINVRIYITRNTDGYAGGNRPEVGAAHPVYGAMHGFSFTVPFETGGTWGVCATGLNVGPGADRLLGCRNVVIPTFQDQYNLVFGVGSQENLHQLPGYLHPSAAASKQRNCNTLPAAFRPGISLPAGSPVYYDCVNAGTAGPLSTRPAAGSFRVDVGRGPDVSGTVFRADLTNGAGGYGEPSMSDVDVPVASGVVSAYGAAQLVASTQILTLKIYRVREFRQFYGVEANGTTWAWKVPTRTTCEVRKAAVVLGFITPSTSYGAC